VLSHYVTDPVHPFHTGQTEAEGAIHRAFEWSTAKSYDELKQVVANEPGPEIATASGDAWLEDMLRSAATLANGHYEKLIAHYDITRGVVDPPAGLDMVARRITGRLIRHAAALNAAVLQRAITEAGARPPDVSLALPTVIATLKIPVKRLLNRMADAADRREVERIYDELVATGTVEKNLPDDDRTVRDLHRAEVLGQGAAVRVAPAALSGSRSASGGVLGSSQELTADTAKVIAGDGGEAGKKEDGQGAVMARAAVGVGSSGEERIRRLAERLAGSGTDAADGAPVTDATSGGETEAEPRRDAPRPESGEVGAGAGEAGDVRPAGGARVRLQPGDDIVDAPSIGPRMAERLRPIGVRTVADLLERPAESISEALGRPVVSAETVVAWQAQARLVCAVPGLSGTGAQLLVGAGYATLERVASADERRVLADVLGFARGEAGQRVLRAGEPPSRERIAGWVAQAKQARAA
jgi:hypothetical protein